MKAVVVYESFWGNTAAIAKAIAEGIGPEARALTTSEATPEAVSDADLVVAGAPLIGFALPTEMMRQGLRDDAGKPPTPPDLSNPSMRAWLGALGALETRAGACATFETRIWWSPGSAAKTIAKSLVAKGYRSIAEPGRFLVTDRYGPLKEGELERAREWGARLRGLAG